jgi:hypothetical protein
MAERQSGRLQRPGQRWFSTVTSPRDPLNRRLLHVSEDPFHVKSPVSHVLPQLISWFPGKNMVLGEFRQVKNGVRQIKNAVPHLNQGYPQVKSGWTHLTEPILHLRKPMAQVSRGWQQPWRASLT